MPALPEVLRAERFRRSAQEEPGVRLTVGDDRAVQGVSVARPCQQIPTFVEGDVDHLLANPVLVRRDAELLRRGRATGDQIRRVVDVEVAGLGVGIVGVLHHAIDVGRDVGIRPTGRGLDQGRRSRVGPEPSHQCQTGHCDEATHPVHEISLEPTAKHVVAPSPSPLPSARNRAEWRIRWRMGPGLRCSFPPVVTPATCSGLSIHVGTTRVRRSGPLTCGASSSTIAPAGRKLARRRETRGSSRDRTDFARVWIEGGTARNRAVMSSGIRSQVKPKSVSVLRENHEATKPSRPERQHLPLGIGALAADLYCIPPELSTRVRGGIAQEPKSPRDPGRDASPEALPEGYDGRAGTVGVGATTPPKPSKPGLRPWNDRDTPVVAIAWFRGRQGPSGTFRTWALRSPTGMREDRIDGNRSRGSHPQ